MPVGQDLVQCCRDGEKEDFSRQRGQPMSLSLSVNEMFIETILCPLAAQRDAGFCGDGL